MSIIPFIRGSGDEVPIDRSRQNVHVPSGKFIKSKYDWRLEVRLADSCLSFTSTSPIHLRKCMNTSELELPSLLSLHSN